MTNRPSVVKHSPSAWVTSSAGGSQAGAIRVNRPASTATLILHTAEFRAGSGSLLDEAGGKVVGVASPGRVQRCQTIPRSRVGAPFDQPARGLPLPERDRAVQRGTAGDDRIVGLDVRTGIQQGIEGGDGRRWTRPNAAESRCAGR